MIWITGDTHREEDINKLSNKSFKEGRAMTRNDYVIVAGDFGFILDGSKVEKWWANWLSERPYNVLFVDGNHENFDMLNAYPIEMWNGGKVHKVADNVFHLMRGQIFNIDGKKIFTFGGATSIDKVTRTNFVSWWEQELPTTQELNDGIDNLEASNWEVDYIITHCCSSRTLNTVIDFKDKVQAEKDEKSKGLGYNFKEEPKYRYEADILNKYFDFIEENLKYKHWFFGHYHIDYKDVALNQTALFQDVIKISD
jgi:Predicted phosphoesterases, related to the Icc protein